MGNGLLKLAKLTGGVTVKSGDAVVQYDAQGRNTLNITKDGIEVRVGQVWRDLDVRMNGRTRKVVEITDGKAVMQSPVQPSGMKTKVSIKRLHKSSTGWELVSDATQ